MTKLKTLSAVMRLSLTFVTPAYAHSAKHAHAYDQTNFRGAYNQVVAPSYSVENFGFAERDPSRVGGLDTTRAGSGD